MEKSKNAQSSSDRDDSTDPQSDLVARRRPRSQPPDSATGTPRTKPGMPIKRERATKVSLSVSRRLATEILSNEIPPGTPLPDEATMLKELGVARSSLREALRILEVYGMLTIKAGNKGGPVVKAVNSQDFANTCSFYYHLLGVTYSEVLSVRTLIEPTNARLAAQHRSAEMAKVLRADNDDARRALDDKDFVAYEAATGRFHSLIGEACGNRLLDLFVTSLKDLYQQRHTALFARSTAQRERVLAEHTAITEAIIRRDANSAEALMASHMQNIADMSKRQNAGALHECVAWS